MAGFAARSDSAAAEDTFRRYLRERGLKNTPERQAVLAAAMSIGEHFEAEQLLLYMRGQGWRVAKATVYRTLPLLADCGILSRVRFGEQQLHYERTYGREPHDHMLCRLCGRIIEFDSAEIDALRQALALQYQFQDIGHRFQIVGVCRDCAPPDATSGTSVRKTTSANTVPRT